MVGETFAREMALFRQSAQLLAPTQNPVVRRAFAVPGNLPASISVFCVNLL